MPVCVCVCLCVVGGYVCPRRDGGVRPLVRAGPALHSASGCILYPQSSVGVAPGMPGLPGNPHHPPPHTHTTPPPPPPPLAHACLPCPAPPCPALPCPALPSPQERHPGSLLDGHGPAALVPVAAGPLHSAQGGGLLGGAWAGLGWAGPGWSGLGWFWGWPWLGICTQPPPGQPTPSCPQPPAMRSTPHAPASQCMPQRRPPRSHAGPAQSPAPTPTGPAPRCRSSPCPPSPPASTSAPASRAASSALCCATWCAGGAPGRRACLPACLGGPDRDGRACLGTAQCLRGSRLRPRRQPRVCCRLIRQPQAQRRRQPRSTPSSAACRPPPPPPRSAHDPRGRACLPAALPCGHAAGGHVHSQRWAPLGTAEAQGHGAAGERRGGLGAGLGAGHAGHRNEWRSGLADCYHRAAPGPGLVLLVWAAGPPHSSAHLLAAWPGGTARYRRRWSTTAASTPSASWCTRSWRKPRTVRGWRRHVAGAVAGIVPALHPVSLPAARPLPFNISTIKSTAWSICRGCRCVCAAPAEARLCSLCRLLRPAEARLRRLPPPCTAGTVFRVAFQPRTRLRTIVNLDAVVKVCVCACVCIVCVCGRVCLLHGNRIPN